MSGSQGSAEKSPPEKNPVAKAIAEAMAGLQTQIVRRKLRELKLLEINARYMSPQEFDQLVENLRVDGKLTSVPLIYRDTVLSGNHRVSAAIKAGIDEGDCMEILTELPPERQVAIQLAHNAIVGKDDPNVLAQLYTSIGTLGLRKYTGVTDDMLQVTEEKMASLGVTRPKYEELVLIFLPEEKQAFLDQLRILEDTKRKQRDTVVGDLVDFDKLFEVLVRVKREKKLINNAVAIRVLAECAQLWLDHEKQSAGAAETKP
jgi:hypothetical protein